MPRLSEGEPKLYVGFRLHPTLVKALRRAARDSADTFTGYVEQTLRERLRQTGYLPPRAKSK